MRRFDKRKNILLANQRLEESYLNSKGLIKEDDQNPETMSSEHNICDIMTANSWKEIEVLLDKTEYDNQFQTEIDKIKKKWENEVKSQSHDQDSTNTYLRMVQNIVCK